MRPISQRQTSISPTQHSEAHVPERESEPRVIYKGTGGEISQSNIMGNSSKAPARLDEIGEAATHVRKPVDQVSNSSSSPVHQAFAGYVPRPSMPDKYDIVIVLGPGSEAALIEQIKKYYEMLQLTPLIYGDGKTSITRCGFQQEAKGKTHPHAPIIFWGHGGDKPNGYTFQISTDTTQDNLSASEIPKWINAIDEPCADPGKETAPRHVGHILSCHAASGKHSIQTALGQTNTHTANAVILHGSSKNYKYRNQMILAASRIGAQCADNKDRNLSATAHRQFAEAIMFSCDAVTLCSPGQEKPWQVKTAKNREAVTGQSLAATFARLQQQAKEEMPENDAQQIFSDMAQKAPSSWQVQQRILDSWFIHAARNKASGYSWMQQILPDFPSKDSQAAINATNRDGCTALDLAAKYGHMNTLSWLLENGAQLSPLGNGTRTIAFAAQTGRIDCLEALKTHCGEERFSVLINTSLSPEGSILHCTSLPTSENQIATAIWLIKNGARTDKTDDSGKTPAALARHHNFNDVVEVFHLNDAATKLSDLADLFIAHATNHDLDSLKRLKSKIDTQRFADALNTLSTQGTTALYLAAAGNQAQMVSWLIENGADSDLPIANGGTPYTTARQLQHKDVLARINKRLLPRLSDAAALNDIETFRRTEAEINNQGEFTGILNLERPHPGGTLLHAAAEAGNADMVLWLLERGANADIPDSYDDTPAMRADTLGHQQVLEILQNFKKS